MIFLQGALGVRCVIYGCDVCGRMAGRWCSGLPEVAPEQWRHAAHRAYGSGGEPPQAAAVGSFSGLRLTTDPRACQGLSILHHRQAKGCAVPNSIAQTARRRPDVPTRAVRVRLTAGGSTDRRHLRAASASARRAALLCVEWVPEAALRSFWTRWQCHFCYGLAINPARMTMHEGHPRGPDGPLRHPPHLPSIPRHGMAAAAAPTRPPHAKTDPKHQRRLQKPR